jgi:hypothetical protein
LQDISILLGVDTAALVVCFAVLGYNRLCSGPKFGQNIVADLAQLVRASGCGSEGRGFETHSPPQVLKSLLLKFHA